MNKVKELINEIPKIENFSYYKDEEKVIKARKKLNVAIGIGINTKSINLKKLIEAEKYISHIRPIIEDDFENKSVEKTNIATALIHLLPETDFITLEHLDQVEEARKSVVGTMSNQGEILEKLEAAENKIKELLFLESLDYLLDNIDINNFLNIIELIFNGTKIENHIYYTKEDNIAKEKILQLSTNIGIYGNNIGYIYSIKTYNT